MRKRLKNKPHRAKIILRWETNFWGKILPSFLQMIGTQAEMRSGRRFFAQFFGKKLLKVPLVHARIPFLTGNLLRF